MATIKIPSAKSLYDVISPPTALIKKINKDYSGGQYLPTPDNDGTCIALPETSTGNLIKYNAAGAEVWSVAYTDINANCDYWTGVFWLDTTDSAIWVWAYDEEPTPDLYYLAKVALSDGTVANLGTCEPGDGLFGSARLNYYTERASMGSGNLTIRDGDRKIILDTTDGSIATAAVQVTQNGYAISVGTHYETSDGAIYLTAFPTIDEDNLPTGKIQRGGSEGQIRFTELVSHVSAVPWIALWGGYVAVSTGTSGSVYGPRFFNRTDFDAWLVKLADFLGLPT